MTGPGPEAGRPGPSAAGPIDWAVAQRTATRLVSAGPLVGPTAAAEVVAGLRWAAQEAIAPVAEVTGMSGQSVVDSDCAVVDRPGWIAANAEGFACLLAVLDERIGEQAGSRLEVLAHVGARVAGVQAGGVLAWLSGRVLGQFEALPVAGRPPRLLLVAPNVLVAERALGVVPADFRLWVALHEQTHRLQFTAVPWLSGQLVDLLASYLAAGADAAGADAAGPGAAAGPGGAGVGGADLAGRVRDVLAALNALRSGAGSLLRVLHSPAQQAAFDRVSALMSLIEGHAEYVMDAVGPQVVPTVAEIRRRVTRRRAQHRAGPDFLLHRLIGLDGKVRQYDEGRRFVATVVEATGMAGFNRVWAGPQALPSRTEIAQPEAWLARMGAAPP